MLHRDRVFLRRERAAENRGDTEQGKIRVADLLAVQTIGFVFSVEDHFAIAVRSHFFEHIVLGAPVQIIGVGDGRTAALGNTLVDANELRGIFER